jgi:hypothetical protein
LTFDWSIINFLSCLENLVALSHISELHTLLRKLSHTHTHALHELSNLFKISICRKICTYWILNSHLYFCSAVWLLYQLIIYACSEANFREKYFSRNFSSVSDFQCEASGLTYSYIRTRAVLPYADLAVAVWTVKWHVPTEYVTPQIWACKFVSRNLQFQRDITTSEINSRSGLYFFLLKP